ncbi:HisA/HisF-related TIM barrel protein [Hyphomicrobium sp. MC1]|uniref:HisA/HisF-related TIM barrel protein n=1 Tax=Hyphomicrobium sp. (strain MC1) TaxID=717785 RepID=UPI000213F1B6|nr:HisA/HisF-related TIM barrel protein [Hyphomicrobium sp. MC1]CCB64853.1 conserved HisA-related protein (Orf17) involved in tetrahydromethanopterin-dependent formaldehyde oxidation [Hyphomicrobium sp. MC1]
MDVIPVIDVARGQVVRAVKGVRSAYRPIETPLAPSSEPGDIARGLARLFPFRKLYLADLDGIEGRGRNTHIVPVLSQALPRAEIWIDAGTGSRSAARAVLAAPVATLVVGTESIETVRGWEDIVAEAPLRTVLSLDFRNGEFMGPEAMLNDASLWPSRVIAMTLDRVGANEGPDLNRLHNIVTRAKGRRVYAAGGVRDRGDLDEIRKIGVSGALIASALHSGKISADDLKEIAGR